MTLVRYPSGIYKLVTPRTAERLRRRGVADLHPPPGQEARHGRAGLVR